MPQLESIPKFVGGPSPFQFSSRQDGVHSWSAKTSHKGADWDWAFEVIRPNIFRTSFTSASHPPPPFPSAKRPSPAPDNEVKALPAQDGVATLTTSSGVQVNLSISNSPLLSIRYAGSQQVLHSDLPFRGYAIDGPGVAHYVTYDRSALHLGLGEKAAPMDLSGRSFRIAATDSFGYDVYKTDPLYKHIPFLITARKEGVVAQFSTSHSRANWSVGCEMDGLWGRYKVYRQDYGGLEEYLIIGKTIAEVVKTYADLVGYPRLVPRWSFGYIAGGYKYTMLDEPRASDALIDFADKLKKHDIPCSAFQMSSGYHVRTEEPCVRNVFVWNRHRFPDPEAWIKEYHSRGIRLLANVKPFLLDAHPDFQKLVQADAFFKDPSTGGPGFMRLWSNGGGESGEGCHLDFTSEAAFRWWYNGVQQLRKEGIDVPWNDNNEYIIPHDDWENKLDGSNVQDAVAALNNNSERKVGFWGRAMHTELMAKASYDALIDLEPNRRPFVLTRSATAGTMRYACSSWSGDNVTSWESMKGANALSLNAGMSLLQCSGHDIGGFEGPQPTPELLVRWVQIGAHSPRFAINCFKTSPDNNKVGEVIEPWMHPEVTHLVRAAIKRRYELIPLLYSLSLESHMSATPPQRWVGWGFEHDPEVWTDKTLKNGESQYWLGDSLIVGGVFQPGESQASVYLPHKDGFTDHGYLDTHVENGYLPSGGWAIVKSAWDDSIPVIARVGGAVPVGKSYQVASPGETLDPVDLPKDDYRGVEIFPPKKSGTNSEAFTNAWYEDDGIAQNPDISTFYLQYLSTDEEIVVSFASHADNKYVPVWRALDIILPKGDQRRVIGANADAKIEGPRTRADGHQCWSLSVSFNSQ